MCQTTWTAGLGSRPSRRWTLCAALTGRGGRVGHGLGLGFGAGGVGTGLVCRTPQSYSVYGVLSSDSCYRPKPKSPG